MPASPTPPPSAVTPKVLTLAGAAAWLAGQGVAVTAEAVRQWITFGCRGPGGAHVRLRSYWIAGRHYTRKRWLRAFIAATTEARLPPPPEPRPPVEAPDAQAERFRREKAELEAKLKRRPARKTA